MTIYWCIDCKVVNDKKDWVENYNRCPTCKASMAFHAITWNIGYKNYIV